MPNTEDMRAQIKDAYSSESWWKKVAKMSDSQVFAVYTNLKAKKRI